MGAAQSHVVEAIAENVLDARVARAVREHLKPCKHGKVFFTRQGAGECSSQCPRCGFWIRESAPAAVAPSQNEFPWDPAQLRRTDSGGFAEGSIRGRAARGDRKGMV
jgi:hypothetical protein